MCAAGEWGLDDRLLQSKGRGGPLKGCGLIHFQARAVLKPFIDACGGSIIQKDQVALRRDGLSAARFGGEE